MTRHERFHSQRIRPPRENPILRARSRAGIRYVRDTKRSCSRDAHDCTNSYVIMAAQSRQLDKLERTDTRARFPGSRLRAFRVCAIVYRINPPNAPCILSTYSRQIFCNIFHIFYLIDAFSFYKDFTKIILQNFNI